MKLGDIIEVKFNELDGIFVREKWVGAIIEEIGRTSYLAKCLKGNFPGTDKNQMWVPQDNRGMWR